jgi:hypothetical protein
MPFKSETQRRYMFAEQPAIAERWAAEYPGQKNLPMHVKNGRNQVANALAKRPKTPKGVI